MANFQISGLHSINHLNQIQNSLVKTNEKISTGLEINRASDSPSQYVQSKLLEKEIALSERAQKGYERTLNQHNTRSSRIDQALNLLQEIEELGSASEGSFLSTAEKDSLQLQANELSKELTTVLSHANLGSLYENGIQENQIIFNGDDSSRNIALNQLNQAYSSLLGKGSLQGSQSNATERQLKDLSTTIINQQASLSTLRDADIAAQKLTQSGKTIMQNLALTGLKQNIAQQGSVLNLFG